MGKAKGILRKEEILREKRMTVTKGFLYVIMTVSCHQKLIL